MAAVLCFLLHYYLFSVTLLGSSAHRTPIEDDIMDSDSERDLQWISVPPKAWVKIRLKLGLDSVHSVYQGCDSKYKNTITTLWTTWIAKKDANELRLDLLFAQNDKELVNIQLLESDTPVEHPDKGQTRLNVAAPQAFSEATKIIQDVDTYLHHAQGLELGKITRNGFHLGFSYSGSCIFIFSVRVYSMKCPGLTVNQTSFPGASAGSGWIKGECVDGAEEVSSPKMKCESNGQWGLMQRSCVCGAGYQTEGDACKACGMGSFKADNDGGKCQLCPPKSKTSSQAASKCDCEEGYGRLQDDPLQLGCTRSPSAPLNLTANHLNNTMLVLNWATPADLGGREEVMYDIDCREKTGGSRTSWAPCASSITITPQSTGLTEVEANITGLQAHVIYLVSVKAYNRISKKLGTSGSTQPITIILDTDVVITAIPVPTPAAQQQPKTPVIVGVLCGILLLLALIPAALCFIRKGYSKFGEDHEADLVPLQNIGQTYRRPEDPQTAPPQQSSVQILDSMNESLLSGIRDVLIDRSRVTLGKELGKGEFGTVYEGVFLSEGNENIQVAVKTMKVEIYSQDDLQSFLKEAELMKHFDHDNIVKLLGVTLETVQDSVIPVPLVILPFMKHGDLRRFLITNRYGDIPMFVPHQSLLRFMIDIASGMEYLASKGFLHRDLAARNCMLGDDLHVRVADFGLSKQISSSNYYRQKVAIRMPVKWMAIESLSESIYTSKSDVWSFGVTMWEIVSRGKTPYPGIPNHELLELLESGHRLKQDCDRKLYEVMQSCWHKEPSQRPCFADLAQTLKALLCELPPLDPSKEDFYINQGLEAANTTQSSAAEPDPEGAVGNIYLPSPVGRIDCATQEEQTEEGYLLCNKIGM